MDISDAYYMESVGRRSQAIQWQSNYIVMPFLYQDVLNFDIYFLMNGI